MFGRMPEFSARQYALSHGQTRWPKPPAGFKDGQIGELEETPDLSTGAPASGAISYTLRAARGAKAADSDERMLVRSQSVPIDRPHTQIRTVSASGTGPSQDANNSSKG